MDSFGKILFAGCITLVSITSCLTPRERVNLDARIAADMQLYNQVRDLMDENRTADAIMRAERLVRDIDGYKSHIGKEQCVYYESRTQEAYSYARQLLSRMSAVVPHVESRSDLIEQLIRRAKTCSIEELQQLATIVHDLGALVATDSVLTERYAYLQRLLKDAGVPAPEVPCNVTEKSTAMLRLCALCSSVLREGTEGPLQYRLDQLIGQMQDASVLAEQLLPAEQEDGLRLLHELEARANQLDRDIRLNWQKACDLITTVMIPSLERARDRAMLQEVDAINEEQLNPFIVGLVGPRAFGRFPRGIKQLLWQLNEARDEALKRITQLEEDGVLAQKLEFEDHYGRPDSVERFMTIERRIFDSLDSSLSIVQLRGMRAYLLENMPSGLNSEQEGFVWNAIAVIDQLIDRLGGK